MRKMKHIPYLLLFCVAVSLSGCGLFASEQNSIVWHEEDLNDFVVYAYAPSGDSLAMINLVSGEIYKRLGGLNGIQSVAANQDGSIIYVSTMRMSHTGGKHEGEIYKVNTESWEYEIIYNQGAHLLENRNGDIFFITKGITYPLSKRIFNQIDPSTGIVTGLGDINVYWGAQRDDELIELHPKLPLVYAIDGENTLSKYNYNSQNTTPLFNQLSFQAFARMTVSWGGDTLYISGGPVLDLNREEIVGSIPVWHLGSVAVRRDNKEVYITDPGGYLREPYSENKIFVYNPHKNKIISAIEVNSKTDHIYLTPKERYAVVNDWAYSYLIVDLKTRKIFAHHRFVENNVSTQSTQGFYVAPKPPLQKQQKVQ